MRTLSQIAINTQIEDAIQGEKKHDRQLLQEKIETATTYINTIQKINGDKVFNAEIIGEYIYYYLKEYGDRYYYPIKYAIIEYLPKRYNVQYNVGKTKYLVNYHNGISTHKDGSDFFDIATFNNKKDFQTFINSLTAKGFNRE